MSKKVNQESRKVGIFLLFLLVTCHLSLVTSLAVTPRQRATLGRGLTAGATSITASGTDSSWTATNTTSTISTSSRTLTVPSGNPGNVKLSISSGTITKYSKNGGAPIAFITDDIISVVTGDTLAFSMTGSVSGDTMTGPVIDSTTGVTIGNVSITHS